MMFSAIRQGACTIPAGPGFLQGYGSQPMCSHSEIKLYLENLRLSIKWCKFYDAQDIFYKKAENNGGKHPEDVLLHKPGRKFERLYALSH